MPVFQQIIIIGKLPNKHFAYGLIAIKCFRGGTGVYYKNCDGELSKEANRL